MSPQDQVALLLWLKTEAELSDHSADRYRSGSAQSLLYRDRAKQFRAVAATLSPPATYRHKKRGTEYVLLGFGKMQSEHWIDPHGGALLDSVDMCDVAIYRSVDDGSLWVRPREEFEDGRFEPIEAV